MKSIHLIILFCICTLSAFCQTMPIDATTGLITYTGIVNCDSSNQKDIYYAAQLWALNAFGTGKPVAQFNNTEKSTVVFKPGIPVHTEGGVLAGNVFYTFTIECKDGKYRYTLTDFKHQMIPETNNCDGGNLENETYTCPQLIMNKKSFWAGIKIQTNDNVAALIANMKAGIANTLHGKKSDW